MIHWKNWAPRLGFAWQPTGDGRTVLRGFAGRYWDGPVSSAWYYPPPGRGKLGGVVRVSVAVPRFVAAGRAA